jgi:hypothetical protein
MHARWHGEKQVSTQSSDGGTNISCDKRGIFDISCVRGKHLALPFDWLSLQVIKADGVGVAGGIVNWTKPEAALNVGWKRDAGGDADEIFGLGAAIQPKPARQAHDQWGDFHLPILAVIQNWVNKRNGKLTAKK